MAIITTSEGRKVDTTMALQSWVEETRLDQDVYVSINTGSPFQTQKLYQSSQRNFYIVTEQNYPSSVAPSSTEPSATFVSERQACAWICKNSHTVPDCLSSLDTEPE